ncbi:MAG: metal-dependent hydrolase [Candidatus Korarchaeota archaeon]|nr:metal-dependent hydrolase [Candidatus Korarchaeota archaeon]
MGRVTFLGHANVLIESGGVKVLFDPWIQGNPAYPKGMEEPDGVLAYVVTHGHGDHGLEDAIRLSKKRGGKVVGIFELANHASDRGADAVGANIGGPFKVGDIEVILTEALHSSPLGAPTGAVVKFPDGFTVYHAGDTGIFPGMSLIGELYSPELAILPIGGHFTMGPREAAKALELLGSPKVLPIHYGTFPVLWGSPDKLRDEIRARKLDVEVVELTPGSSAGL